MDRYLLDIKADDKPVLLERVLRVIRHRGFVIKQVAATQNHESKVASVEIIVDSDRPISFLINQIEKLWDVRKVEVLKIRNDELLVHQSRNLLRLSPKSLKDLTSRSRKFVGWLRLRMKTRISSLRWQCSTTKRN